MGMRLGVSESVGQFTRRYYYGRFNWNYIVQTDLHRANYEFVLAF